MSLKLNALALHIFFTFIIIFIINKYYNKIFRNSPICEHWSNKKKIIANLMLPTHHSTFSH